MAQEKERDRLLSELRRVRERLQALRDDKEVQEEMRRVLSLELDVYAWLLAQGKAQVPESKETFDEKAERTTGRGWGGWIDKLFDKANSLLQKFLMGS